MTKVKIATELIEELTERARRSGRRISPAQIKKLCLEAGITEEFFRDRFLKQIGIRVEDYSIKKIKRSVEGELNLKIQLACKKIEDHHRAKSHLFLADYAYLKGKNFKLADDLMQFIGSYNRDGDIWHDFFSAKDDRIISLEWVQCTQLSPDFPYLPYLLDRRG